MSIRIYTPKGVKDADIIHDVAEALKNAGIEYDLLTTTTVEALISQHKRDPDAVLSQNSMEALAVVAEYDERAAALIEENADAVMESLQAKMDAVKKLRKKSA